MAVTLLSIRTQARQRADQVNSTFISDAELNSYINNSYAELYDLLVSRFEGYYVKAPVTFTIASGASTYALPSDFYKLKGVDRLLSGNEYYTVQPFNFQERNRRSRTINRTILGSSDIAYRILGDTLYIVPDDMAPGTYRIWYIPVYTALTTDGSTLDGINGWEEYVVLDAAIKMMIKEETDVTAMLMLKQQLTGRIEAMARNRDEGRPERISDVRINSWNSDVNGFGW